MTDKLRKTRIFIAILLSVVTIANVAQSTLAAIQEAPVDFRRDVLPILGDHCFNCHGGDEASREGGLRLDQRGATLSGGDSGLPAIVPGEGESGELLARIFSDEPGLVMPPPETNRPLTEAQRQTLKQWIESGAPYSEHWAFIPPVKPPVPDLTWPASAPAPHVSRPAQPLDRLVLKQLNRLGWQPNVPAPDTTLVRRLYLDLIGLPPSPAEVHRYREVGHQQTVEELLARPQYGERWGRIWLDLARFSDTNGYEKDLRREQWIWRDWVIQSFNRDQPYDQFVIEQLAGDLLPDATQDQRIATGFLRNSMLNEEGAIIAEEFRMAEMFDRMDCLGKAVLGLTTQCAQCHTHKFDPLTHTEYFGLFAYLNNSYEAQSWVYSSDQDQQRQRVLARIAEAEQSFQQARPTWRSELLSWAADLRAKLPQWHAVKMDDLGSVSGLNHPVQLADDSILMLGHTSGDVYFLATPELQNVSGLQLEILTQGDLPFGGPGRSSLGTWGIQELEVWTQQPDQADWKQEVLTNPTADWSQAEQSHQEGKQKSGPVEFLIDGSDSTWWQADRGRGRRNQDSMAVVQFGEPLTYPAGTRLKIVLRMNNMVGCCRVSLTQSWDPQAAPVAFAAQRLVQQLPWPIPTEAEEVEGSVAQWQTLFSAWTAGLPEAGDLNQQIAELWETFPEALTSVLHLQERPSFAERTTYLLDRGHWNSPLAEVRPHTPAFLPPVLTGERQEADGEPPRLQFARWLVSRESPLAARVAVNRVWQAVFGRGLVATPEDFGTRAPVPEHLELLDWLAVEFMEQSWSHKNLLRLIVNSQTYCQDSRGTPEIWQRDPDNRWLARGPRFRADAEVVRDIALATSGLLSLQMGGPSVIPPVPQNVLDYNYVYPSYWSPATGEQRYRRTVYGFRKRSMPDPATSNFDAPNGDTACVQRVRSNTPLAALTGLNETIFLEAARGLGLRILRESEASDESRVRYGFELCTGRTPAGDELAELLGFVAAQRRRIADGWLDPRQIATGSDQLPDLPSGCTPQDAATWAMVGRVLLNLDETLSRN
jgi:hypothetical protein